MTSASLSQLSTKSIPPCERLMFALDVPDLEQARHWVRMLDDQVWFYKLGLEFFLSGAYFELAAELKAAGKKIFADLKLFDVPNTVASAVRQLVKHEVDLCTVHGNDGMLKAAVEAAAGSRTGILAVTALTSLDQGDLNDLGFQCDVQSLVLSRARRALEIGCAGVVSSGLEVSELRKQVGEKLVAVCPGIRPVSNDDDQKRIVSVPQAFVNGADYIVVGRPIRNAENPYDMAATIQNQIAELFTS